MTSSNAAQLLTLFQPSAAQLQKLQMAARLRGARSVTEVLIADSNAHMRGFLQEMLSKNVLLNSCKIYTATTAKEAWSQYFSYAPDLCFVHVSMPEIDGYRLSKLIHVIDKAATVVMIAKDPSDVNPERMKECGAKGLLSQPYELQKLQLLVQKLSPPRKAAAGKRK